MEDTADEAVLFGLVWWDGVIGKLGLAIFDWVGVKNRGVVLEGKAGE